MPAHAVRAVDRHRGTIKDMVLAPAYRHMPLSTLARFAQRVGKVFAAASTWARLENVNSTVDGTLLSACLDRILAQVEVAYSNSMIEAFWRSLKHGWLYLNTLDSIEHLRSLVAFYVEQHNEQMPHRAFGGQTPDEIYFGTATEFSAELAVARGKARAARLATNRALACEVCLGQQKPSAASEIPP